MRSRHCHIWCISLQKMARRGRRQECGGAGRVRAHLMISCSRCSSCFWRIMTPSMMARSSGVRCERSGMSAMAGGSRARRRRQRCAGPPRAAVLCPRRDAKRATQPGGLFNNAGRANRARPSSDVSTFIDCAPPPHDARPPYRAAASAAVTAAVAHSGHCL